MATIGVGPTQVFVLKYLPDDHESSAGREHRLDRSETAKIFARKAGSNKGNNPAELSS